MQRREQGESEPSGKRIGRSQEGIRGKQNKKCEGNQSITGSSSTGNKEIEGRTGQCFGAETKRGIKKVSNLDGCSQQPSEQPPRKIR